MQVLCTHIQVDIASRAQFALRTQLVRSERGENVNNGGKIQLHTHWGKHSNLKGGRAHTANSGWKKQALRSTDCVTKRLKGQKFHCRSNYSGVYFIDLLNNGTDGGVRRDFVDKSLVWTASVEIIKWKMVDTVKDTWKDERRAMYSGRYQRFTSTLILNWGKLIQ